MSEWTLSDKINVFYADDCEAVKDWVYTDDVREAVKELQTFINENYKDFTNLDWQMIDFKFKEIFGEKLI